jgi:adenylosuccinate synthase
MIEQRTNSSGLLGVEWGDEGKAKFADAIILEYAKTMPVIDIGINGGANAGHNINFGDVKIALHQLPSGVFIDNVTTILGKNRVVNPQGLIWEIEQVKKYSNNELKSSIKINNRASLALRTHQALEYALKQKNTGNGATGQGIGPAFADQDYRNELSVKDLYDWNVQKFEDHYDRMNGFVKSLGFDMSEVLVPVFSDTKGKEVKVGSKQEFIDNLKEAREYLKPYIQDVYGLIKYTWKDSSRYAYFFEASQAVGLHREYGVHPDVTASDTTFLGINTTTEGLVHYEEVKHRMAVIKGPYGSSVGTRKLPTIMPQELAERIRQDYNERGATTGRNRDIVYKDMPALRYYYQASYANEIGITHMDSTYEDTPIKICDKYLISGEEVDYRPYQDFLNSVEPHYIKMPTWDSKRVNLASEYDELPKAAKDYTDYLARELKTQVTYLGTGPKREDIIKINA